MAVTEPIRDKIQLKKLANYIENDGILPTLS